jgi:hypothetical protein
VRIRLVSAVVVLEKSHRLQLIWECRHFISCATRLNGAVVHLTWIEEKGQGELCQSFVVRCMSLKQTASAVIQSAYLIMKSSGSARPYIQVHTGKRTITCCGLRELIACTLRDQGYHIDHVIQARLTSPLCTIQVCFIVLMRLEYWRAARSTVLSNLPKASMAF